MQYFSMKSTLKNFLCTLHEPSNPSLLAFLRICFGLFMMIDIPQERGMARADSIYGTDTDGSSFCSFPFIDQLKPFTVDVMVCLYAVMFLNAFFIMIGYLYRINTISFILIYWYFFLLDTSSWNNHSYLYGLIAFLLCMTDANKYLAVDSFLIGDKEVATVPHWNYIVFRFQVFLVYFYAGLKKTENDWITGYSMHKLSREWVFDPLRPIMSDENIDFWIVHICGFIFDTSVGFLLFFGKTRSFGLFLCFMFHGMNAMVFNIGVFPYVMFASSFIFCNPQSFMTFLAKIPIVCRYLSITCQKRSGSGVSTSSSSANVSSKRKWSQFCATVFCISYMSTQAFLPYSHFITKGYNGWTDGLYGYSWDMMVHSFTNQHVRISYKDLDNGDVGYLKPGVFLSGKRSRWSTQPTMAFQYAKCIEEKLKHFGIENAAVYFDVWKSLNKRFQQRIFNPDVDIANYPWSPFEKPSFVMPLLTDLSDWREELRKIKEDVKNGTSNYSIVFVADFPGMHLDNYLSLDIGNVTLNVLQGEISLEEGGTSISLKVGDKHPITAGEFHRVYTVSAQPSCYYYIYMNTTRVSLKEQLIEYENWLKVNDGQASDVDDFRRPEITQELIELYNSEQKYKQVLQNITRWDQFTGFLSRKVGILRRSSVLLYFSIRNIVAGKPLSEEAITADAEYLDLTLYSSHDKLQQTGVPAKESEGMDKRIDL